MSESQIRQSVTARIVEALQNGLVPWRVPWSDCENTGSPANVVSKMGYAGVSRLLLQLATQKKGFRSKWWGTREQWTSLGGRVPKRGTKIVAEVGDLTAFNADEVEGEAIDQHRSRPGSATVAVDYSTAETVIAATAARICHVPGDNAFYYYPPADYILLPLRWQFETGPGGLPGYFYAVFHELAHWSERRLGWKGSSALVELRAEIVAAFLAIEVGIPCLDRCNDNHARYLPCWVRAMKLDHAVIFEVAAAASTATDFILSFSRKHGEYASA
jgi:antirestriction protein ArdC